MNRLIRSMKFSTWALATIYVFAIASVVYAIVTGEQFGADVHYDLKGRVLNVLVLVVFVGYGLYSFRDLHKLRKEAEELRGERHDEPR